MRGLGDACHVRADVAQAVLFAMTSTFRTGQTLHIDGGEPPTSRRLPDPADLTMAASR